MKKILLSAILLTAAFLRLGAEDRYAPLDSLLKEFYVSMDRETVERKCLEFDLLIGMCRDSSTQRHVATEVFEHYKEPVVMGDEAVAVHVYDRWFADGTVRMDGEFTKINAELFANFNRSTLIGCDAPSIGIFGTDGRKHTIPSKGKSALFFFYDTACAKCKYEKEKLPEILSGLDFPIDVYAVYCGSDKKEWKSFRRSFKITGRNIKVLHFWDPEVESNYLKLYGVLSTPKIYFMEPSGKIIGRRLDDRSLIQMLPVAKAVDDAYRKTMKSERYVQKEQEAERS